MSKTLYVYRARPLNAESALQAFARVDAAEGTALLYAPAWCRLARWASGTLSFASPAMGPVDLQSVYEMRLFTAKAELRWLNDPSPAARHTAVVVAEEDQAGHLADWSASPMPVADTLPRTYLLWGEGESEDSGWSTLAGATGRLAVPLAGVGKGERVVLQAVEYLSEDLHGNLMVCDERLTGLVRG